MNGEDDVGVRNTPAIAFQDAVNSFPNMNIKNCWYLVTACILYLFVKYERSNVHV